jgi:hypothetical protein
MAYDRQYRPVTAYESGAGAPYTPRYARDLADACNNFKATFGSKVACLMFTELAPFNSRLACPSELLWPVYSELYQTEQIMHIFAPRYVSPGHERYIVQCIHSRVSGAGDVTWRLRTIHKLWGAMPISWGLVASISAYSWSATTREAQGISYDVPVAEWTTSNDARARDCVLLDSDIRSNDNNVYFLLTAEHSDDSTLARLWNLDITPTVRT